MASPIISVKKLSKTYTSYRKQPGFLGSVKSLFSREKVLSEAVKGISFEIDKGEMVGFLGPNGAGKTTTLKMLSGILHPSGGEARMLGYTPWERKADFQKRFALVMGQKTQLWWDLPAMESFLLNKEIYGIPDARFKKTLDELTTMLDIAKLVDVPVRKLSLGERMKCELVAALLHNPEVLLLDEPTIGLDVTSQLAIREFLRRYNASSKTTVLLTSHYMEDVEALCERIIVINQGQKVYDGDLDELVHRTLTHKILTVTFTERVAKERFAGMGDVREHSPQRVVLHVPREQAKAVAARVLTELPTDDILIDEPPIEDVIRRVFAETHAS
ncbi:ATP-binding cassette domain-containing protein [Patescibacteria group bacterium]|nr:MAG: ATP-binding cassette domain-containing protein [Patescibacteria group bacterium]